MKKKPSGKLKQKLTKKLTFLKMDIQERINLWPSKDLNTALLFTTVVTLVCGYDATLTFIHITELILPAAMWLAILEATLSRKPTIRRFFLYTASLLIIAFAALMSLILVKEFEPEKDPALQTLVNAASISIAGAIIMLCFVLAEIAEKRLKKDDTKRKKR